MVFYVLINLWLSLGAFYAVPAKMEMNKMLTSVSPYIEAMIVVFSLIFQNDTKTLSGNAQEQSEVLNRPITSYISRQVVTRVNLEGFAVTTYQRHTFKYKFAGTLKIISVFSSYMLSYVQELLSNI